jgi:acetyl-CoA C-acetyltransferase
LHEVPPIELAAGVLRAIRDRNGLDTGLIDDVVFGCVEPVGEQGADIARLAALHADYAESVAGVQVNRFCASGLEATNIAAGQIMAGQCDVAIGGGVESMSRVPIGSSGGAWMTDPAVAFKTYFIPQGISADLIATKWGFSRTDVDLYAVESQRRAAQAWNEGRFTRSVVPVKDELGLTLLERDEHMRPGTTMQALGGLKPSFAQLGAWRCSVTPRSRRLNTSTTAAILRGSSMAPPRSSSAPARLVRRWGSSRAPVCAALPRSARNPASC